jgi:uncharacterized protein (TIGR02246 family)
MPRTPRAELEAAFQGYQDVVVAATRAGDWSGFADMFTEDASYVEHAFGRFSGREEIRDWVTRTMGSFPGNTMTSFPVGWYVVDEDRGWVVCEIRNLMPDPGDGSRPEASNLTVLHYGGDGLWKHEEDVYNPLSFLEMARRWCDVAREHDRLLADGQAWYDAVSQRLR